MTKVWCPPIVFLIVMFSSLQGFWNALIHVRPRHFRHRREQQAKTKTTTSVARTTTIRNPSSDGFRGRMIALRSAVSVHPDEVDDDDHDDDEEVESSSAPMMSSLSTTTTSPSVPGAEIKTKTETVTA